MALFRLVEDAQDTRHDDIGDAGETLGIALARGEAGPARMVDHWQIEAVGIVGDSSVPWVTHVPCLLVMVSDGLDRGQADPVETAKRFGLGVDVLAPAGTKTGATPAIEIGAVQSARRVLLGSADVMSIKRCSRVRSGRISDTRASTSRDEGTIVISTNYGVIAALDSSTGAFEWLAKYMTEARAKRSQRPAASASSCVT